MASWHVVTDGVLLLSPLGMNKELAGHMVFNTPVSQPDPPGKQLASLFFSRGFARYSGGRFLLEDGLWSGSAGTRGKWPRALIFIM